MVKLLVFAILLASSPATALLEQLYNSENYCYAECYKNYAADQTQLDACRKGCDFKLLKENCVTGCNNLSPNEKLQAACQVGCTLNSSPVEDILDTPDIAIDPVPADKVAESTAAPAELEVQRPPSIILIRLRQRPSIQLPAMHQFFGNDPMQMFNEMIKQFQEHAKAFEESIRTSVGENADSLPKLPNQNDASELPKLIPIIHIPLNSFDLPSDEQDHHQRMMHNFPHHFGHPHGAFRHGMPEEPEQNSNRLQQFVTDVRTEWNDLIRKQPKIPIWIFLAIFLSSSAILWYMIMSLCHQAPSRDALSIRAQELVFHPYDYEGTEKEKIQPDDDSYDVTESVPIKVKLTNI